MGEALIVRKGGGIGGDGELRTEVITSNMNWVVPKNIKNKTVSVRIFGGGGAPSIIYKSAGAGSGWMNNGEFTLTPGDIIPITIGAGAISVYNLPNSGNTIGGTTSFGTYLSANGGDSLDGGAGGYISNYARSSGGRGYQFGGGGGTFNGTRGGDGGQWGGGGGGGKPYNDNANFRGNGGNGGIYGGGGGSGAFSNYSSGVPGNGGTYGGGGCSGIYMVYRRTYDDLRIWYNNNGGIGGTYGGNGSVSINTPPTNINGTDTINNLSVPENLRGNGLGLGYQNYAANLYYNKQGNETNIWVQVWMSGGGGFGGTGGCVIGQNIGGNLSLSAGFHISGPGGGGYGGHGGNILYNSGIYYGAGGGGYGGNGESILSDTDNNGRARYCGGGGGGYFSDGYSGGGGGYYNYCHAGSHEKIFTGFGSGGGYEINNVRQGITGACIIQYWI